VEAGSLPEDSHIRLVHDAGDASAVWSFGDAFLKVKLTPPMVQKATKEHVTLNWLNERENLNFSIPKVLHHAEADDRTYLLITRVPGTLLADAWRDLADDEKSHYIDLMVKILQELSSHRSDEITGIDGGYFADGWLDVCYQWREKRFEPDYLQHICSELGMDYSTLVFAHCDLGPYNIIVDRSQMDQLGLIDWEMAGFIPRAWIRTKFGVSFAMNFEWPKVSGNDPSVREWRVRVEQRLGEERYPEVLGRWDEWRQSRQVATQ
jgi:hypothetical protein